MDHQFQTPSKDFVGTSSPIGEFLEDVVLWRRGDVSACVLAGTVSSAWLLSGSGSGSGSGGYTLLSLSSSVLLLLLSVLFLWSKAARLLNRPAPPIPELRVSRHTVVEAASLLHSGLDAASSAFRDIALARDTALFYQVFLCLWLVSIVGSLTDFTTICYTSVVGALTIPAMYQKYQECIDRYMRFAYINLQMYEMVYERFSTNCFLRARDWIVDVIKEEP